MADAICPRCSQRFHCGAHDATPCACTGLALTAETQRRLRDTYSGCLCLACLREIAARPADVLHVDMKKPARS